MANHSLFLFSLFLSLLINYQTTVADDQKHKGFSMRLIAPDSPEKPFYEPNTTRAKILERLVRMSDAIVQQYSLMQKTTNASTPLLHPENVAPYKASLVNFDHNNYLVKVKLGSFKEYPQSKSTYGTVNYLLFDTATSITWAQCEGCNPCFAQGVPVFPKSQSSSYKPKTCASCPSANICRESGHFCRIDETDFQGVHLVGIMALETFRFESDNGREFKLPNMDFICASKVETFFPATLPHNMASGILAMDISRFSFIRQREDLHNGIFSYCLQPIDPNTQASRPPMFLRFGRHEPSVPGPIHWRVTTIIKIPESPRYWVPLLGLSVDSTRLQLGPKLFMKYRHTPQGTMINTATSTTYIIREAYDALEAVLVRTIEARNQNLRRINPPRDISPLCYEEIRPGLGQLYFPTITFHFKGQNADFIVEPEGYIGSFDSPDTHCLLIKPSPNELTLLGTYMQVNHLIEFHTRTELLSWAKLDCSTYH